MKKMLILSSFSLVLGSAALATGVWFRSQTLSVQARLVMQGQQQVAVQRAEADGLDAEWSPERLQKAKEKAEKSCQLRMGEQQWAGLKDAFTSRGLTVELQEIAPATDVEGRRVRLTLGLSRMASSSEGCALIQASMRELDGAVGGCQRVALALGSVSSSTRVPAPSFVEGSQVAYEFNFAK